MINLDTKLSIVIEWVFKGLFSTQGLYTPTEKLVSYNNEKIEVLYVTNMLVEYKEQSVDGCPFTLLRAEQALGELSPFR